MSFILDALKKSENARQRQIGPAMAELPRRRYQSDRPWWALVVAGLLLVNVGVLILVLARNRNEIEPVATAAAAPVALGSGAQAARQLPPDSPTALPARGPLPTTQYEQAPVQAAPRSVSSLADEAMPGELGGDGALLEGASAAPPVVRPIQAPAVAPLSAAAPAARAPAARGSNVEIGEMLPTVDELAAGGRTFPPMRLDIHAFSETPAERFVFVNMRKYSEGQVLQEGPSIERITAEGVILNQQGLRFMLQRQ